MSEIEGSGKWFVDAGQRLSVEREFIVPWAGHVAWVAAQIGTADPMIPICRCRQARVEPIGTIGGSPAVYAYARVTLTYIAETDDQNQQVPDQNQQQLQLPSGARLQIQVRGNGDFLLFPARDMRWGDNLGGYPDQPIPQDDSGVGRVIIPMQDWIITLSNLGGINVSKLTNKLGHVNSDVFLGYSAGTVLFESYDVDWQWSLENGQPKMTWSCAWHFKVRAIKRGSQIYGWNYEYRGTSGWVEVRMADGTLRYEDTAFADIFT